MKPSLILFSALLFLQSFSAIAQYQAYQVDKPEQITLQGDMVWGGVGDWQLSNGEMCVIISSPEHEGELAETGGYLTDFGWCKQPGEGFGQLYFVANLQGPNSPHFYELKSELGEDFARIKGRARHSGFELDVVYELNKASADRLQLKLRLHRVAEEDDFEVSAFGLINLNRGNKVFSGSLDGVGPAPGFKHLPMPAGLWDDLNGLVGSDFIVSLPDSGKNPVVYSQRLKQSYSVNPEGEKTPLASFVGVTDSFAAAVTFSEPFVFDNEGRYLDILKLLESQIIELPLGHSLVMEQEIAIARGRDVASILNQYWQDKPLLSGQLFSADEARRVEPNVSVFLYRADGGLANHGISNAQGEFQLRAPAGDYRLQIGTDDQNPISRELTLSKDMPLGDLVLSPAASLLLPQGEVMRLTFVAEDNQAIDFSRQRFGFSANGKVEAPVRDVMLTATAIDPKRLDLPPGRYRVIASRGPEYSAHEVKLELAALSETRLQITEPQRLLKTPGYIHADLHTHAAPSFDNSYPQQQRIASYLAQGGEVLVATEHETVYDYSEDIAKLGLSDQLATVTGTEMTGLVNSAVAPHTLGHANAFPLSVNPAEYRRGVVAHENRRWRDVLADVRAANPKVFVQLNHPRVYYSADEVHKPGSQKYNESYFEHLLDGRPYDPAQALSAEQNRSLIEPDPVTGVRDIDFDAMELINGTAAGFYSYELLRKDWFALLRQGVRMVGTATSDSHGQAYGEVVLEPRTLIALEKDTVAEFDQDAFIQSIKKGNLYGTTGPLLQLSLQAQGQQAVMGDTFSGKQADLHITVDAAPWISVDTLRVYINGELHQQLPIKKGESNILPLSFEQDGFVTLEVEGKRDGLFADIVAVMPPFAFTNPIYIDADADGQWQAPGLIAGPQQGSESE